MVSVLAFYSDDSSSNPAGYSNLINEKMKIKRKRGQDWPNLKKVISKKVCLKDGQSTSVEHTPRLQEVKGLSHVRGLVDLFD